MEQNNYIVPSFFGPNALSIACCLSKTVKTPNKHGTSESRDTCMIPLAVAPAIYSKCIVSPLMRQPRHTMTSTRFDIARNFAVIGSSNAPGTCVTKMLLCLTPAVVSDSFTPWKDFISGMSALKCYDNSLPYRVLR